MSLETNIFEFDRFVLDIPDQTLYFDGQIVNLSIKAFDVLRVLFENRPHVVEKKALMAAVWPDSFVEEGNLTFTISQLRKALDDSKKEPRIIETVHRRGYRFIATAREQSKENSFDERISRFQTRDRWIRWSALTVAILAILGVGGFMLVAPSSSAPAILRGPLSIEKLSTSGTVVHAVIAPDGKYVIYTNGTGRDQQSIWLRQLESGSTIEIVKPTDSRYLGLAISPDSNFLYFARTTSSAELSIFRLSIFGGIPQRIVQGTQGWMSLSPDGQLISYVKCRNAVDENCSLYVANAVDGTDERRLVTHNRPMRIGDNEFAPDGRSIAYAYGQSDAGEDDFRLAEVDLESGAGRDLTPHRFFNIKAILWLPDKSGWLVTANKKTESDIPIVHVPADGSAPVKLVDDSETYSGLSAAGGLKTLVTTRARRDTTLHVIELDSEKEFDLGGPASSVVISSANRVYYSSAKSGNFDIWSANADGSDQKQLTNSIGIDFVPLVAPDGSAIFFSSARTGEPHIWRMNADGGDQSRITKVNGGWPLFVTKDGQWLYYREWARGTLWRTSTITGEESEVLPFQAYRFSISPDGSKALANASNEDWKLYLFDIEKGEKLKTFEFPEKDARVVEHGWLRDRQAFIFIAVLADGTKELWRQELAASGPKKIRKLTRRDPIHFFALAPDGRRFAVIQGDWQYDAALITAAPKR